jgi:hypothetical protein
MTNVHEIKRTSFLDVPAKLRELATMLESRGTPTKTVIIITADGSRMEVRGFGERTSGIEVAGYLSRALWMQNDLPTADAVDEPPAA